MTTFQDADLLGAYRLPEVGYDEMLDSSGARRPHWDRFAAALGRLESGELAKIDADVRRLLDDDGVTYHSPGGGPTGTGRWELDPVPFVLSGDEWRSLETAIAQRTELLDRVLSDLYGARELLERRVLPPEVVFGHPGFLREVDQVRLPGRHQLFLSATDIVRDSSGQHIALSDRTQAPSGVGYALENRTVVSRGFARIYRHNDVQRLAPFIREMRAGLRRVAPKITESPRIVLLTPGSWSETAFEHAHLASYLGLTLVKGNDLRVRDGRVWMRTLGHLEPVHVILRRVDASYCDPLELRPDSQLGIPGLLEACRLGNVSVVNTLGSGVLESPALLPFLPRLAKDLLGESLRLPSVSTWWCGEAASLSHVVANLSTLVLKPVDRDVSRSVIGWELDAAALDDLRRRIEANPQSWVGQERVAGGTVPALVGSTFEPRRSVLRTFAVATGNGYRVMPGGLTRVAADPSTAIITSHTGAVSKDTWVLSDEPETLTGFWLQPEPAVDAIEPEASMPERAAENLFWLSRYAERAESFVRLMRVVSDRRNEFASATNPAGDAALDVLLPALNMITATGSGFVGDAGAAMRSEPTDELRSLVCDPDRTGSLAYNVARMLEAASEVRDQLSNDVWLVVGHLDSDLSSLGSRFTGGAIEGVLGRVLQGLLALAGLSAESMVRDPGWQFMEIGRRIERALQLCRLLGATLVAPADQATASLVLESTLTAAESIITYRRRYRGRAHIETVLDLLLLDPDNPRSLGSQLARLTEHLAVLPGAPPARPSAADRTALAAYASVRTADTAALAKSDSSGNHGALNYFLDAVIDDLMKAAYALDHEHFTRQLPQHTVFVPNSSDLQ